MNNRVLGMWRPETITATVWGQDNGAFRATAHRASMLSRELAFVELMSDPCVPRFASNAREIGTAEETEPTRLGTWLCMAPTP